MALVVEDGTGKANAESYVSVAEVTAYFAGRGSRADDWDAIEDQEAAIRGAMSYLLQVYSGQWAGLRSTDAQALDWPRINVPWRDSPAGTRPDNVIPSELKAACAELALRTADGDLLADTERETLSERVDVISVTYAQGRSQQTQYPAVHGLLRSLLTAGGGAMVEVERA